MNKFKMIITFEGSAPEVTPVEVELPAAITLEQRTMLEQMLAGFAPKVEPEVTEAPTAEDGNYAEAAQFTTAYSGATAPVQGILFMTHVEQELLSTENQVKALTNNLTTITGRIVAANRKLATLRLMNDIRLGRIIPVIAETGTVADVTFS